MNRSLFHQLHDRCPIVQRNTNEWNKHVRIRAVFHNNLPIVSSTAGEVFYDISSNVFIVALYKNALDFVSVQITPRRLLRGPSIDSNFLLFESIINSVVRLPRSRGIFESRVISKFGTCQYLKRPGNEIFLNRFQVYSCPVFFSVSSSMPWQRVQTCQSFQFCSQFSLFASAIQTKVWNLQVLLEKF